MASTNTAMATGASATATIRARILAWWWITTPFAQVDFAATHAASLASGKDPLHTAMTATATTGIATVGHIAIPNASVRPAAATAGHQRKS